MRFVAAGILMAAALVLVTLAVTVHSEPVLADRMGMSPVGGSSKLVTLLTPSGDNGQQLVLVEPEMHVICVYKLDSNGKLSLLSVRNFHWDLQMEQFNGTNPLPSQIRAQLSTQP